MYSACISVFRMEKETFSHVISVIPSVYQINGKLSQLHDILVQKVSKKKKRITDLVFMRAGSVGVFM
jgi:hypothetical protein